MLHLYTIVCNSIFVKNTNDTDQIVRGMLYFAVLACLEPKENYAARILLMLEDTPFSTRVGTLYPLMTRMQEQKLIESRWVIKQGKPPMRYYRLTANGTKKLNELREILGEMNKVLKGGKK